MRRRILAVGQTDVYLHLATVLFGAYVLLSGAWQTALAGFASIVLHEGAHALAAALLGQPPQEIEVTPMGAVMRLEDEERMPPVRRAVMLAAGPTMTTLLAHLSLWMTAHGWLSLTTGRALFLANAAILMVNLLPALPLDGGRLLALLLGRFLRGETVSQVMRATGTLLGLCAIGGSIWLAWRYGGFNWSLAAAGCFLMYAASTATVTQAMAELRRLMDRKITLESRGVVPIRRVAIMADLPLHRALRMLHPSKVTEFAVMERGTMRSLGVLTETEVVSAWLEHPELTCAEAARTASPEENPQNLTKRPCSVH